ncbi:A-kinase anchor protein 14-like [Ptychodera flava]|uniref:A-kinase anchor protein 14-like n=1 Tax=Ptychodera flava TaxID=63121 RepID=UPI00396A1A80
MGDPDLEQQAHVLVDRVISNARRRLITEMGLQQAGSRPESTTIKDYDNLLYSEWPDYDIKNIKWMRCDEFTSEKGIAKIEEFIKTTWEYIGAWLYCIDFLREEEDEYSKFYRYQVRWSIPTRRKPIPRATACVYFTVEVSKIKPGHFPVEVYYVFEANRLVHKPGMSRFRESWLKDIIESKLIMVEGVQF